MSLKRAKQIWLHGLVGAAINSAASAVSAMVVDPVAFNFSTGLVQLLKLIFVSAIIGAALYLKQSPLPPIDQEGK